MLLDLINKLPKDAAQISFEQAAHYGRLLRTATNSGSFDLTNAVLVPEALGWIDVDASPTGAMYVKVAPYRKSRIAETDHGETWIIRNGKLTPEMVRASWSAVRAALLASLRLQEYNVPVQHEDRLENIVLTKMISSYAVDAINCNLKNHLALRSANL